MSEPNQTYRIEIEADNIGNHVPPGDYRGRVSVAVSEHGRATIEATALAPVGAPRAPGEPFTNEHIDDIIDTLRADRGNVAPVCDIVGAIAQLRDERDEARQVLDAAVIKPNGQAWFYTGEDTGEYIPLDQWHARRQAAAEGLEAAQRLTSLETERADALAKRVAELEAPNLPDRNEISLRLLAGIVARPQTRLSDSDYLNQQRSSFAFKYADEFLKQAGAK